nr:glycosyltransferase family 2 protein [uncultured Cohaesibacter sp.]
MLLSVVIPWHRNPEDLQRAVKSVLAQTWQDLEILVVANGVTDHDLSEAKKICDNSRTKLVTTQQKGPSFARNLGMERSKGELIFFLDADDVFLPNKLEVFAEHYQKAPFDLAFSRGVRDRGNGVEIPMPRDLWDGDTPIADFFFVMAGNISSSALVISKSAAAVLAFKPPPYEDPDLVIQAEQKGMVTTMLPQLLYIWSDYRTEGRLSREVDVESRMNWISSLPDNVTKRARLAFKARCVAQHIFPKHFLFCLRIFFKAGVSRAVPLREILLFILRGLLPKKAESWLLDLYFTSRSKGGTQP